jgi:hypothetical protein
VLVHKLTGRVIWVELKSDTGRIRPEQHVWMGALQKRQEAFIWRPVGLDVGSHSPGAHNRPCGGGGMNESWRTESGDTVEVFGRGDAGFRAGQVSHFTAWYWHLKSPNNQIIATSGESFTRKWSAKRAAQRSFPKAES